MKKIFFVLVLAAGLGLPLVWSWSDDQYAKIKAAGAKNTDTATDTGVLLNTASKTADLALFYHLQGNDAQADLWLAVAWQDFQQVQAPTQPAAAQTMPAGTMPAPAPSPAAPAASAPAAPAPTSQM